MRWTLAAALVFALGACGATASATPTASPPPQSWGYFGANATQFKAVHGACPQTINGISQAADTCFGAELKNNEGCGESAGLCQTYQFAPVSVDSGIVDGYVQNFTPGTTIDEAKSEVLQWLPKDATVTSFGIEHNNGSCAYMNLSSPTLATDLGNPKIGDSQGVLGVVFSYTDTSGTITYDPNNIQEASVGLAPIDPTTSC